MCVRGVYTLRSSDGTESPFKWCVNKRRVENRGRVWVIGSREIQCSWVGFQRFMSHLRAFTTTWRVWAGCVRGEGVRGLDGGGGSEVEENTSCLFFFFFLLLFFCVLQFFATFPLSVNMEPCVRNNFGEATQIASKTPKFSAQRASKVLF